MNIIFATMFQKRNNANQFLDWDKLGFWVSMVCGVHCVAMPIILGVLPFTGSGETIHHSIELTVLLTSFIVGLYALITGYFKHKKIGPAAIMMLGFAILILAHAMHVESLEMILMPLGACGLAIAHLRNHRLLHLVQNTNE